MKGKKAPDYTAIIKELRKKHKQAALAKVLGVGTRSIMNYENGAPPSEKVRKRIIEFYETGEVNMPEKDSENTLKELAAMQKQFINDYRTTLLEGAIKSQGWAKSAIYQILMLRSKVENRKISELLEEANALNQEIGVDQLQGLKNWD